MIPSVYWFALLTIAAASLWKLVGDDRILDRPRDWLLDRIKDDDRAAYWGDFLVCPWCAGFWESLLVYAGWIALGPGEFHFDQLYMAAVVVMAMRALVGLFGLVVFTLKQDLQ